MIACDCGLHLSLLHHAPRTYVGGTQPMDMEWDRPEGTDPALAQNDCKSYRLAPFVVGGGTLREENTEDVGYYETEHKLWQVGALHVLVEAMDEGVMARS